MRTLLPRWARRLCMLALLSGFAVSAFAQRTVTLQLNTATLPDTLDAMDEVQVRGCLAGCEGDQSELPGDQIIAWNDSTTLTATNDGGDYWSIAFQIPEDDTLNFKFYSQLAEDDGVGGWEDGADHQIPGGTGDTTLVLHFYEKGDDKAYDWRPYEEKEDTIAVWFRVFMNTEDANTKGYDPEDTTQVIGVRGSNLDPDGDGPEEGMGPLDWDSTQVTLTRESTNNGAPGYHLFSGVAYYAAADAGTEQPYKFFAEPDGWEDGDDRTFTIPASDTTLQWVYFGNSTPLTQPPVAANVLFAVDLTPLEDIGVFDRARGDSLRVYGSFNSWQSCPSPDQCDLFREPGTNVFAGDIPLELVPGTEQQYKFFIDFDVEAVKEQFSVDVIPSGWEEPISTQGSNRRFIYEGTEDQIVGPEETGGVSYYNDILPGNIIPAETSVDVMFSVDMTPAMEAGVDDPFEPATDSVTVEFNDPVWSLTQGLQLTPRDDNPDLGDAINLGVFVKMFNLTDEDEDGVYTGTLTVNGPTYSGLQYKYAYGTGGTFFVEPGGGTSELGRRRTRFIAANEDGSWPESWQLTEEPEVFQVASGPLPYDENPAETPVAVEPVGSELPTRATLSQNFPNPFNPTTTFEYAVPKAEHVRLTVYDLTGRVVATLVDGVQPASTYRVTFDATSLASGVYFYRLQTESQVLSKKMILLK